MRTSIPLTLLLAFALTAPLARPAPAAEGFLRASRLLSPAEPALDDLTESWRRGLWERDRGMLRPRDRAEGARLVLRLEDLASASAGKWLGAAPSRPAPLGLRVDGDLKLLAFASDPHRQIHPLFLDLREGEAVDPAWRWRLGVWADAALARGLSAHLRFVWDSDGRNDPHNRTQDFNQLGASNNLDEAYLRYRIGPAAFTLGRRFLDWGPSPHGSLILSPLAPAPDQIHAELDFGKHRLQAFVGRLSSENAFLSTLVRGPQSGELSELEIESTLTRHVYGHRLEITLWRFGNLGLSELALVARPSGGLDLGYLNPVGIHVVNQTEENGADRYEANLLHQLDAEFWLGGWHLYGAFLVDDLQIDSAPRETWPDQLAASIGVDRGLGRRALLSYEYRRVGSWTYLHRGEATEIRQFASPLAAPEGPDMDRHLLELSWRASSDLHFWVAGEHRRRGINRIDTDESREGHAGEGFPRAPIETRWVGRAGARWSRAPWVAAEAFVAYHDIEGVNNGDTNEEIVEFRAMLHLFSPALLHLLPGGLGEEESDRPPQ